MSITKPNGVPIDFGIILINKFSLSAEILGKPTIEKEDYRKGKSMISSEKSRTKC